MTGYVEMREACIWIQTIDALEGELHYRVKGNKDNNIVSFNTAGNPAHTAHIVISNLEPGTEYEYRLYTGSKLLAEKSYYFTTQQLWQYRTDPPDFTAAIGSCAFINEEKYDRPGAPYGDGVEIFNSMADKNPDLTVWLGDNTYFREVDWNTMSGMIHRYTHTRSIPEIQRLLSESANYAIWDDHDFGPNDSNGSFIHKNWSLECFKYFWANNSYGLTDEDGITSQFTWGDIDFFLLDNRYFRTAPDVVGTEPTILGEEQIQWLIQALKYSKSPFKMVCMGGQFLNPVAKYETYAVYSDERARIIRSIEENKITGVVFLTGDRHCSELNTLKLESGITIYDLTVSPLTSKFYDNTDEPNNLRVNGTLTAQRNFATLTFTGDRNSRKLSIANFDTSGKLLWQYEMEDPARIKK
jgi:alkaline phosphatase D